MCVIFQQLFNMRYLTRTPKIPHLKSVFGENQRKILIFFHSYLCDKAFDDLTSQDYCQLFHFLSISVMYEVKGSRAIITGSAQGFGKEFAKRLLGKGCKVCLSDIDEVKGEETKSQFQKQFGLDDHSICFIKCDVSVKDDWNKLWDSAEKNLGGKIDILINNAGLSPIVSNTIF